MLAGYLLQMAVGDKSTPKGGHAADVAARAASELSSAYVITFSPYSHLTLASDDVAGGPLSTITRH